MPIPNRLKRFILGHSNRICIWMKLSKNQMVSENMELHDFAMSESGYCAHGGMLVSLSDTGFFPQSYRSSYSVGLVHIEFWYQFSLWEKFRYFYFNSDALKKSRANIVGR